MPSKELEVLQENYKKELEEISKKKGGCSKCQKNSIRRRFKKLILNQLAKTK